MPPQQEKPSDGGMLRVSMRRGGVLAAEEEGDPIRGDHKLSPPHAKETRNGLFALLASPHLTSLQLLGQKSKNQFIKSIVCFYLHKLCYFHV
jgi:hypothetical protein